MVVGANVASPDHRRASPLQRHRHGRGLGVVQHHHVSRGQQGRQRPGVAEGGPVEHRQLPGPEHAAIAWLAVQMVMKALGHLEEPGRTAEHHPPDVDPRAFPVRQQRTKQLRNSTTQSGRVHHPHRPSAQQLTGALPGHAHPLHHRQQQIAAQVLEMPGLKRNLGQSVPRPGRASTRI